MILLIQKRGDIKKNTHIRNICLILPDIVKRLTNKTHMMQFAYSPVAALAFIKSDMPNFIKFFFLKFFKM